MASSAQTSQPNAARQPRSAYDPTEVKLRKVHPADGLDRTFTEQLDQQARQLTKLSSLTEGERRVAATVYRLVKGIESSATEEEGQRRVSDAFSSVTRDEPLDAPARSVPKWVDRDPEEFPTAESFLRHYFGSRLGLKGDLSIAILKQLDGELLEELKLELAERQNVLKTLLPTQRERGDDKLRTVLGYVPSDEIERKSALAVISRGGQPGVRGPYIKRQKLP